MFFFFLYLHLRGVLCFCFFFQAEDGIRDLYVTGVQTCALPIWRRSTSSGITSPLAGLDLVARHRRPRREATVDIQRTGESRVVGIAAPPLRVPLIDVINEDASNASPGKSRFNDRTWRTSCDCLIVSG